MCQKRVRPPLLSLSYAEGEPFHPGGPVGSAPKLCAATLNQSGRRETTLEELGLNVIAGVFVSIFEGKLGDARFIELAQAFRDHAVVLFLGRARKW